ncbi:MAG: S-layer homology domain-containing protein [Bacillaceae bacterium]|nr:S-layer homology domain-containing protein [Bacillaceae bacterium]
MEVKPAYRSFKWLIVMILAVSMIFPASTTVMGEAGIKFNDVSSSHWALKHIVKMEAKGIVSGYGGLFRPDDPVTEAEAVIMAVRALGLEEEAKQSDDAIPFEAPSWAKGYIAVALDQGLIKESEKFEADQGASRAWVARLMVRMIGKETEANTLINQTTSFTDDLLISQSYRGYINAAVQYELVKGNPDGSFQPNKTVTRSQMVTFLSRSDRHLDVDQSNVDRGTFVRLNGTLLTLQLSGGSEKSFITNENTFIYNGDERVSLQELPLNVSLMVISELGTARYIEVIEDEQIEVPQTIISGTVQNIVVDSRILVVKSDEGLQTYVLDAGVIFENQNGVRLSGIEALSVGDQVELTTDNTGKIVSVKLAGLTDDASREGVILAINEDSKLITIETDAGMPESYYYRDQVEVVYDNVRFPTVSDLSKGDRVELEIQADTITKITLIKTSDQLIQTGVVKSLQTESGIITLETDSGLKSYYVSGDADVFISGLDIPELSDVQLGDQVEVEVRDGQVQTVTVLNRQVQTEIKARVVAVDVNNRLVTYQLEDGTIKVSKVSPYASLIIDDLSNPTLADLNVDANVVLELDNDEIIRLQTRYDVLGEVVRISEDTNVIQLRVNGERIRYVLSSGVDVHIQGMTREDLDDINEGDTVQLRISNNVVTDIDVQAVRMYKVEDVNESRDRLETIDEDGDDKNLYIRGSVELVVPGITNPELEDVQEGVTVRATFLGNALVKVEVLPHQLGEITSLNLMTGEMTLMTFDGTQKVVDLGDSVEIEIDGQIYHDIRYLGVQDRVEISEGLEGSKIIKVMNKVSGEFVTVGDDFDKIYIIRNGTYEFYSLHEQAYLHQGDTSLTFRSIPEKANVTLYLLDDRVYEVVVD